MNLKLEFEFSKADILKEVAAFKKQVDDMRPLPPDVEGKVMQKLRLDWNYNSNAIEGNKLSYGETVAFLMEGITAKGKPLKDHLDIRGHNEAINFLLEIVKDTRPLSEADIRSLHKMILVEPYDSPAQTADGQPTSKRITLGEYKTSPNHVKTATGEIHYYATPEDTPAKMRELMEWYEEVEKYEELSPIIMAALFHHKFVEIHPFDDGNGRLSRILMNLILMQSGYPPVVIKMDDRKNYYSLLSRADNNDSWPFVEYISELQLKSLQLYLKAANGGDIDDENDVDKEIALFKIEVQSKTNGNNNTPQIIYNITINSILPLIYSILNRVVVFDELFYKKNNSLTINYTNLINRVKDNSTTDLTNDPLDQSLSFFAKEGYKIDSLYLDIGFDNFKNLEIDFSVIVALFVDFEENRYVIRNHNLELTLYKSYSELINDKEKKRITETILRDIKNLIEDNIK